MSIHPTAWVHPKAELGADVSVGPFCVIEDQVEIGDRTRLGAHAVVMAHTRLGPDCAVHAHAVLGDLPQDLAFKPAPSYVRIGARCIIREGVTIHRGTRPETETVTGDDCFLMANSHLAHNVRLGNRVILANGALLAGYVEVGDRAFISGNAVVHQFCRVGKLAMLSGGSAASKDVPPFCTTRSSTLNRIAGLNVVGLRRAGFDAAGRLAIQQAFRTLFLSGLNVSQALASLHAAGPAGPVAELCAFIEASKRGICRFEGLQDDSGA